MLLMLRRCNAPTLDFTSSPDILAIFASISSHVRLEFLAANTNSFPENEQRCLLHILLLGYTDSSTRTSLLGVSTSNPTTTSLLPLLLQLPALAPKVRITYSPRPRPHLASRPPTRQDSRVKLRRLCSSPRLMPIDFLPLSTYHPPCRLRDMCCPKTRSPKTAILLPMTGHHRKPSNGFTVAEC